MAYGGNRPIAPARKLIAAVLGTVAAFVVLFGIGMTSFSIVALGVALVALAIALATLRTGGRAWIVGVGHVEAVSPPPTGYSFGRCELQLVVDAPGMPPRAKKLTEPRVPVAKWPTVGQTLPIRVALDDQRRVRVLWDEVDSHREMATATAELPLEYAGSEPVDETLIHQDDPPWATRDTDDDHTPAGDPHPDEPAIRPDEREREPVVVHHRPGGPIVLEGTVVEPLSAHLLPRRATPAPRVPAEEHFEVPQSPAAEVVEPPAVSPEPAEPLRQRIAAPISDPVDLPLDVPGAEEPPNPHLDEVALADEADVGAPPISGVGITVLVTDLPRSLEFYRDVLGFEEVDQGAGNAILAFGGTRLVLREVSEAAPISRRLVHVNLEVDDIDAAHARLRESGVRFTYAPRVVNRGAKLEVWAAAFRDPDGHGIALTQWRSRAQA